MRTAGEHVVAVDHRRARVEAVVEAKHHDRLVRHRPHRHHRADRDRAGAEVGAARATAPALLEQHADVTESQRNIAGGRRHGVEFAIDLGELPPVVERHVGEGVHGVLQPRHPLRGREAAVGRFEHLAASAHVVGGALDALEQFEEAADEFDLAAADVVDRSMVDGGPGRAPADRDAEREPVHRRGPGVALEPTQAVLSAVGAVEPPPHVDLLHPGADAAERVVVESETVAHRFVTGEVEHFGGGEASGDDRDEALGEVEQRVGGAERTVGQLQPQLLAGVGVHIGAVVGGDRGEPEGGLQQRRERLDVGAHHDDVAGLEAALALREHPGEHLAQHLHLARSAVAGVHLEGEIVGGTLAGWVRALVVSDIALQQRKTTPDSLLVGARSRDGRLHRQEVLLELAHVAGEGGQQRVAGGERAGVVDPGGHGIGGPDGGDVVPQRRRGVWQPQVHVTRGRERLDEFAIGAGEPGVSEERNPLRQIGIDRTVGETTDDPVVAFGDRLVEPVTVEGELDDMPPQRRLPGEVGRKRLSVAVGRFAALPLGEHLRTVAGVGREQAGDAPRHDVAARLTRLALPLGGRVAGDLLPRSEVAGDRLESRCSAEVVDRVEGGPHEPVAVPRVVAVAREQQTHQRRRGEHLQTGTDAVVLGVGSTEGVRQPLAEPAFDAAGGHDDDLGAEDVGGGVAQHRGQARGELVGPVAAVDVEGHAPSSSVRLTRSAVWSRIHAVAAVSSSL